MCVFYLVYGLGVYCNSVNPKLTNGCMTVNPKKAKNPLAVVYLPSAILS